jgi:hypothetical protein
MDPNDPVGYGSATLVYSILTKIYVPFLPKKLNEVRKSLAQNNRKLRRKICDIFRKFYSFREHPKKAFFVVISTCRLSIQNTSAHRRRSIFFRIRQLRLLNRGDGGNTTTAAAVTLVVSVGFLRGVAGSGAAAAAAVQRSGRVATSRGGGGQHVAAVRGPRAAGYGLCAGSTEI